MKEMLPLIRSVNSIIQNTESVYLEMVEELLDQLRIELNSNAILTNKAGEIMINNGPMEPQSINVFKNTYETKQTKVNGFYALIIPLKSKGVKIGTFIFYREDNEFDLPQAMSIEYISTLCTLILSHAQNQDDADKTREVSIAKAAISTLSYSELEAIVHIFKELKLETQNSLSEGLLVASKVADKAGITRTVIVNAIRKFESAGVIESRSLGMKGTFIKVTNKHLIYELNKLN